VTPDISRRCNDAVKRRPSGPQSGEFIYTTTSHLTNDFDPKTIEVLNVAIQDAWREIQNGGGPLARPAYARITRAVIAKRIIEMAKKGERDQRKLSEYAVRSIILNQQEEARSEISPTPDKKKAS
jgi:hypothetical protein